MMGELPDRNSPRNQSVAEVDMVIMSELEVERASNRFNVTFSKSGSNTTLEDRMASGELPDTQLIFLAMSFGKS